MSTATMPAAPPDRLVVESELLGPLEIDPAEVIDFPGGLLGFPECRRYALVATRDDGLYWLQSLEHRALVFLVADPFRYFDGYALQLSDLDLAELRPERPDEVAILVVVTLPSAPARPATANLQGPLAINLATRRGRQTVAAGEEDRIRCPIDLQMHR